MCLVRQLQDSCALQTHYPDRLRLALSHREQETRQMIIRSSSPRVGEKRTQKGLELFELQLTHVYKFFSLHNFCLQNYYSLNINLYPSRFS